MSDEGGETTVYFDAQEGTFRTSDGEEVEWDMSADADDAEEEEEDESQQEANDEEPEGSQTPQAAASTARPTQTITSMPPTAPDSAARPARRPNIVRRLSTATQRRVSLPVS